LSTSNFRITIGLPVYNGEKYLSQAIDSILNQTYSQFQLIISDNASTDRTQAICLSYAAKDPRIVYVRNEKNLGAAPNYKHVFDMCATEYFRWAAYDDRLAPEHLEKCIEVLDQNPDIILCYSRALLIDEQNRTLDQYSPTPNVCALESPNQRFRQFILYPTLALQTYGVHRTNVLKRTKLIQSFPSSDLVFLAELSLQGKFYEHPDCLFLNRVHKEQSTQGALASQRSRVAFFDTSLAGKVVLAHWLFFFAALSVIQRAPIRASEKIKCYFHMLRWCLVPDHFRAMGKDILLAIQKFFVISGIKIRNAGKIKS
jgi:glycosyltransferase involved in cell wall biosynthesis